MSSLEEDGAKPMRDPGMAFEEIYIEAASSSSTTRLPGLLFYPAQRHIGGQQIS